MVYIPTMSSSQFSNLSIMSHSVLIVVSLVFNLILLCDCGRILVLVPTPSISHQVVFRPLTQELAKRGHEVVVLTTDPAFPKGQSPANLTEIDVHDISYKLWIDGMANYAGKNGINNSHLKLIAALLKMLPNIFEAQMNNTEFQNVIYGDKKFDLIIVEGCVRPALVLPYILKTPVIVMNSFGAFVGQYEMFGVPSHPFLYPTIIRQKLYNLGLWEKMTELYNQFLMEHIYYHYMKNENQIVRRIFGSEIPSLSELQNNLDMLFVNTHPIFEGNVPVPPGVVHIWGIHKKPQKEVPQVKIILF